MAFIIHIKTELLPKTVKFKENEEVDWGKKSLKEKTEQILAINLADELHIAPNNIFKHLLVTIGETVAKGQVLARKKNFMSSVEYKAPEEGEVRGLDHEEGTLTLAVEKVVSVPFAFRARFLKKEKDEYQMAVTEGVEVAVNQSLETNFGGYCSYLHAAVDIGTTSVENKVVLSKTEDIMDQAKIAALGPVATINYQTQYRQPGLPLLLVRDKHAWSELFAKKWPMCLYLQNQPVIYFYRP